LQDYQEHLVLKEVESIINKLPFLWTLGHSPSLFSSLKYFPLNNLFNNCISDDFYQVVDSCTTSTYPKTFHASSFARRYANVLGNTLVETTSNDSGDKSDLVSAAKAINLCTLATRNANADNGGLCHYFQNNIQAGMKYVPGYELEWLPENLLAKTDIRIRVNAWRESIEQPWKNIISYKGEGERLEGSIVYSRVKIVVVNPTQYHSKTQKGWYVPSILNGIRDGVVSNLKYSAISDDIFSANDLRRARLFFLVGHAKFLIKESPLSITPTALSDQRHSGSIQLTPHLKIPSSSAKACLKNNKNTTIDSAPMETLSQWDSGDLYQDAHAGLIVAIIEDTPLI